MYCPKCGNEINDDAEFCAHCGCKIKNEPTINTYSSSSNSDTSKKLVRFILTFFLGFIGSLVINHSNLKPEGWKSRTCAYFFLGLITFGIYILVASICNFTFDENQSSNIGYFKK